MRARRRYPPLEAPAVPTVCYCTKNERTPRGIPAGLSSHLPAFGRPHFQLPVRREADYPHYRYAVYDNARTFISATTGLGEREDFADGEVLEVLCRHFFVVHLIRGVSTLYSTSLTTQSNTVKYCMPPKTQKLLDELKAWCNEPPAHGKRTQVAQILEISPQTITNLFGGRQQPTAEQILNIQDFLQKQKRNR
jgi:hypothetical protein